MARRLAEEPVAQGLAEEPVARRLPGTVVGRQEAALPVGTRPRLDTRPWLTPVALSPEAAMER